MLTIKNPGRLLLAGTAGVFILGLTVFWWMTVRNPRIAFLARHEPAQWILYPTPPDGVARQAIELSTEFHRSFSLDRVPERATLAVRAFHRGVVTINGKKVGESAAPGGNWKDATEFDVSPALRAGTNEITVTVFNKNGPPALWLSLAAGGVRVNSDGDWDASFVGAAWHKARLADQPMEIRLGNMMFGGEDAIHALARNASMIFLWLVLAAGIVVIIRRQIQVSTPADEQEPAVRRHFNRIGKFAMVAVAVLWVALFANNMYQLPGEIGFDVRGHLKYIDYLRVHRTFPQASEGWEMHQPPLYYVVMAGIALPLKVATRSDEAIWWFRLFGLAAGVVHILLIFLTLRLLFPGRLGMQLVGLLLAAFVPEHLYLSQYVTNEPLVGLCVSAAIYFCVRLITGNRGSWRLAAAAGFCLGAGLLSKVTAVLAVPFVGGALVTWLYLRRRRDLRAWVSVLGSFAAAVFITCGWHYLRVWRHSGIPVVNDWDPPSGFPWWGDAGYLTAAYFTRFGECLTHPFYSAFHGFPDGLYSSLWGDGTYGSQANFLSRPPWNYDLMAAGYWLALAPTILILTGAAVGVWRLIRRREPAWFLLIGLCAAAFVALIYVNLKLPFYGSVKAFYAFVALLPLCGFAALGWSAWNRLDRRLGLAAGILLGAWALNAYASFWVRDGAAATHISRGMMFTGQLRSQEAQVEFTKALRLEPNDLAVEEVCIEVMYRQDRLDEARQWTEQLLQANPADAKAHWLLGIILNAQGQWNAANEQMKRAIALAPDFGTAYQELVPWLVHDNRYQETVDVGREALRVLPLDSELHACVGQALTKLGREDEARSQLELATSLTTMGANDGEKPKAEAAKKPSR